MPKPRNPYLPHSRHSTGRGLVVLPDQCDLPAPALPTGRAWSTPEKAMWRQLWGGPQASQWDDSFAAAVAQFVVHATTVIRGEASAWMAQEARHLGDRLGLTPQGMTSLGWRLAEPGEATPAVPLRSA